MGSEHQNDGQDRRDLGICRIKGSVEVETQLTVHEVRKQASGSNPLGVCIRKDLWYWTVSQDTGGSAGLSAYIRLLLEAVVRKALTGFEWKIWKE